ncbi:hypothetical protein R1sor_000791 [Riccia sorocarpa]|uniref:Reverse transcriptase zinc-binding domain-containing protein n=1 Tax=Riccia sorocarpa TaxID=122646 RepID=A0ABD3GWN9_9MARC
MASSRYFFAKLKSKWRRESLEALELEDGVITTDKGEIMDGVQRFYQGLFQAEVDTVDRQEARRKVISLINNSITSEESLGISRLPDKKEIEGVDFGMKNNKAPGQDGLTAEMVKQPTRAWTQLLWRKNLSFKGLSCRWEVPRDSQEWERRWTLIWNGCSNLRFKLGIWRILHRGFPTLSRAAKWSVSSGLCPACSLEVETIPHLFWEYIKIRDRVDWVWLAIGGEGGIPTFLHAIDKVLLIHKVNPGPLILLIEHCRVTWLTRNSLVFNGRKVNVSVHAIMLDVQTHMNASLELFIDHVTEVTNLHVHCRSLVSRILRNLGSIRASPSDSVTPDSQTSSSSSDTESNFSSSGDASAVDSDPQ